MTKKTGQNTLGGLIQGPDGFDISSLTDEEKEYLLKVLNEDKNKNETEQKKVDPNFKSELVGNIDGLLDYLKDNCVEYEKTDWLGYGGYMAHIKLPKVGNFEGLEINMFSSRGRRYKKEIDEEKEIEPFLYSINDIARILDKINEYLKEYGLNDENINYSKDLKEWRGSSEKKISRASMVLDRLLSSIFGYNIRLKDKNVGGKLGSRAHLSSKYGSIIDPMQFYIDYSTDEGTQSDNFEANVLLKDEE